MSIAPFWQPRHVVSLILRSQVATNVQKSRAERASRCLDVALGVTDASRRSRLHTLLLAQRLVLLIGLIA